eukprot:11494036-Ditylum_brightwellii.AAC.1
MDSIELNDTNPLTIMYKTGGSSGEVEMKGRGTNGYSHKPAGPSDDNVYINPTLAELVKLDKSLS